ncbi:hypothetical protein MferCBS49748_007012 [Microsporum ferrugineum]
MFPELSWYAIEICVPECHLATTASQLVSYADVFRSHPWPDESSCNTDYLKPYPRFEAFIEGRSFNVIVLPDTLYHLDPLPNNIVQIQTYPPDQIRFSRQLDYSKDLNALSSIPIPRLATLLQGASQRYLESKVYAMAETQSDGIHPRSYSKQVSRISEFQPDNITIFVETEEEAQTLRMIPGYNELSWSREQQTQPKEMQMQNSDLPLTPVLSNHEFYWISHQDGLQAAKALEGEPPLFGKHTILNRNRVDINRRVTILGCTLWSHIPEVSQLWVRMKVADFSIIKDWTVEAHNTEHNRDVQ